MTSIRTYQGHTPVLGQRVYVDPAATVIGRVELGDDASIWPGAVLRGDVHFIRVGARSNVQDGAIVHVTHDGPYSPGGFPTVIGEGVTVGHGAVIHACTIEDYCLIGMHATVLDGAVVKKYGFVGAGSLVPPGKVLESGFLYVGGPAKKARPLRDKERGFFTYTAGNYVKLKDLHIAEDYHA